MNSEERGSSLCARVRQRPRLVLGRRAARQRGAREDLPSLISLVASTTASRTACDARAGLSHLSLPSRSRPLLQSRSSAPALLLLRARPPAGGVVADWRRRRRVRVVVVARAAGGLAVSPGSLPSPPTKDEPGGVTLYAFDAADSPRRLCIEIVSLPAHGGLLRGAPRHARQSRPRDSALGDVPEPTAGERLTPAPHARRATDTTYIIHVYLPRGRHAHRTADTIYIYVYIYIYIYIYTSMI